MLALFTLIVGKLNRDSRSEAGIAVTPAVPAKAFTDQRELLRYKRQQKELGAAVKAYFDEAIASGDVVGAGVSIVHGDSAIISEGFGWSNYNNDERVNGQTIFRLGSLSKGFTGVLAARLKSKGVLDWEDKVCDYITEFQFGGRANASKITLANILSHTSGAPYHTYTNLVEAGLPLTEIAARMKNVLPISKPGEIYSYQNAMFALSGEVMYKATGQTINSLLESNFFGPLQMCSTTMDYNALKMCENVALPHYRRQNGWKARKHTRKYYNAVAAGGINASAEDMGKWMLLLLGHKPEVMDRAAIKETFVPFVEIGGHGKYYHRWPGHVSSHYGFGWRIHNYMEDGDSEKTIWHHGGSVDGYRNEIAVYPETDIGICVLLNSNSGISRSVIPDLYKIVRDVLDRQPEGDMADSGQNKPIPNL